MDPLPDLLALCATWLAAVLDARTRRIPNWLSFGTALAGMGANIGVALFDASGPSAWWSTLSSALEGGGFSLLCFGLLSVIGLLGFGDAKLLAAVGLCVRLPLALRVAPCVLLSGGLVALLLAVRGGKLRAVLRNLGRMRGLRAFQRVDEPATELHLFPFATAIALGTTWAVAGRYLPVIAPF